MGAGEVARSEEVHELVAGFDRLSREEMARLLSEPREDGRAAEQLVEGTLWLVLETARSRHTETIPLDDLFQEGSTALVTLVHGLDPQRPLSPNQFQDRVRQVVGQVMDSLVAEEEAARREDLRWAADSERLFAAEVELRLNSEIAPTDGQLAAHLGWPEERVVQLRRAVGEARSQHDVELMDILGEIEGS